MKIVVAFFGQFFTVGKFYKNLSSLSFAKKQKRKLKFKDLNSVFSFTKKTKNNFFLFLVGGCKCLKSRLNFSLSFSMWNK